MPLLLRLRAAAFLLPALLVLGPAPAAAHAIITTVNANAAGVGFNDPAPASPVGGNTGTTIGQQRLIAFQYAADLWGTLLDSPVEIKIRASFEALSCTATTGTLGSAGPAGSLMDFAHAPLPGTWYPSALANRIAGTDLLPDGNDITAKFQSNLGATGCLEGSHWYYGLDNQHGDAVDLVEVLLHEFAHGLGFVTLVDDGNGAEFLGRPDVFETHILDTASGKHWDAMTAAERLASSVDTGHVMWDGAAVTSAVPATLEGLPVLTVTAPADLRGDYDIGTASFGPLPTEIGASGHLVEAHDPGDANGPLTTDACSPLTNASEIAGQIALADRGTCTFVVKAQNAQAAGAIGLVIVDNVAGTIPPGLGGDATGITIPSVSLTQADGGAIRAGLDVQLRIRINPRRNAGAGLENRMLLFAPNPVQSGSSTSHWDTSALPNLLMEPNISGDLLHAVDLTLPLLRDIGWTSDTVPATAPRQLVDEAPDSHRPGTVPPRP